MTVSDHELAADRDDEKDVEETKRLLYVALTRARDRLYLAGTSTDGKLQLQRGSLGRVLPPTLPALMATTAPAVSSPGRARRPFTASERSRLAQFALHCVGSRASHTILQAKEPPSGIDVSELREHPQLSGEDPADARGATRRLAG